MHMLPHQLPQLFFYPHNSLVYFLKKDIEGLCLSYGSIGSIRRCSATSCSGRSVPMRRKYTFVRCRFPVSVFSKFLTPHPSKNTKTPYKNKRLVAWDAPICKITLRWTMFLPSAPRKEAKKINNTNVLRHQFTPLLPESRPIRYGTVWFSV